MKYKLVIFDLDGTLLDTAYDLCEAVNYGLRRSGLKEKSVDEVRSFLGNGIHKLIEKSTYPVEDSIIIEKVFADFKNYYREHCTEYTREYEGITALIDRLKENNIHIAILSNKADFAVKIICKTYFGDKFDIAYGEREGVKKKPCPAGVWEIVDSFGLTKEECVFIGDSEVDIQTSKNAGIDSIIVDWGFRDREFLIANNAHKIVSSVEELGKELLNEGNI